MHTHYQESLQEPHRPFLKQLKSSEDAVISLTSHRILAIESLVEEET